MIDQDALQKPFVFQDKKKWVLTFFVLSISRRWSIGYYVSTAAILRYLMWSFLSTLQLLKLWCCLAIYKNIKYINTFWILLGFGCIYIFLYMQLFFIKLCKVPLYAVIFTATIKLYLKHWKKGKVHPYIPALHTSFKHRRKLYLNSSFGEISNSWLLSLCMCV